MLLGQSLRKAVITILDPIPCAEVLPSRALSLLFCGLEPVSIAKQCKSFWSLAHGALTSVNVCNKCFVYKGSGLVLHLFGLPCTCQMFTVHPNGSDHWLGPQGSPPCPLGGGVHTPGWIWGLRTILSSGPEETEGFLEEVARTFRQRVGIRCIDLHRPQV